MRGLALCTGLIVLAMIWLGPLLGSWRTSFSAHMLAHMGVIAIAAPLIALGLPRKWRPRRSMLSALPLVASMAELLAVWSWHAPAIRAAAEVSVLVAIAEQGIFLAVGILLWWSCLAGVGERLKAGIGASALLLTSIHMTLLGALLALSPRPLYGTDEATCFGFILDAASDQQLGGVFMLLIGATVYLGGGVWLASRLVVGAHTAMDGGSSSTSP
ncbi:cytochrome-c oxidase [Metarhizobium album]|uniref:Cytochrome-c oxidase n=1 Tax=Metarhizobium album TaxID=2182425 RepID=A0A2U2DFM5_9HYPH|nr:cytochrome c oxidase assembly protein [Rhizobium album]PWE52099.1 cytochrome-c oxidase [Rhizobium album]